MYPVGYLEVNYSCIDFDIIRATAQKTTQHLYINLVFDESVPFVNVDIQELISSLCGIYEVVSRTKLDLQCDVLLPGSCSWESCLPKPEVAFVLENQTHASLPTCVVGTEARRSTVTGKTGIRETSPKVAVGGTFDRLHAGHKVLLTVCAIYATETVVIGLANGPLLKNKKYKELLEPFEVRKQAIDRFINLVNPRVTPNVVCLEDVAGPTLTDENITGLVASEESKANAIWVNDRRREKGWNELSLIIINLVGNHPDLPDDNNHKISSTGLRERAFLQQKSIQ
eukprot:TRINITY_DN6396_c0_g1_i1.p1 TRINITY_DN6396_c0_g1~~TRINITY_DN6396_c0_g1_i1.p1  ORF type:complete len:292 (-),score=52.22 TRINITY_DN6396_c0_g1_i1:48-899(-)